MKFFRILTIIFFITGIYFPSKAQDVGLSFSYFIPKNGYFSTPISPFSLRGVGIDINNYVALESGFTLYRMSGLQIKDLPFESKEPFLGPTFTFMVPVELVLRYGGQNAEFKLKGGGFAFVNFASKLNEGNLDRAIRLHENWEVANSDFSFENKPGVGLHAAVEVILYFTKQWGISVEAGYFLGDANLPISGSYRGGNASGGLQTIEANYDDAKVDYKGWEFSIGILFSN